MALTNSTLLKENKMNNKYYIICCKMDKEGIFDDRFFLYVDEEVERKINNAQ